MVGIIMAFVVCVLELISCEKSQGSIEGKLEPKDKLGKFACEEFVENDVFE